MEDKLNEIHVPHTEWSSVLQWHTQIKIDKSMFKKNSSFFLKKKCACVHISSVYADYQYILMLDIFKTACHDSCINPFPNSPGFYVSVVEVF